MGQRNSKPNIVESVSSATNDGGYSHSSTYTNVNGNEKYHSMSMGVPPPGSIFGSIEGFTVPLAAVIALSVFIIVAALIVRRRNKVPKNDFRETTLLKSHEMVEIDLNAII